MKFSSQESHKNFQIFFGNLVKIISRVFFTLPSVYVRTYARNEQHYRSQINLVPGLVFNSNYITRALRAWLDSYVRDISPLGDKTCA